MQRRIPVVVAIVLPLTLAVGGCSGPVPETEPKGPRPVVLAEHPVLLESDQQDTVVWPIWGGAFVPEETVTLRARVEAGGDGASGLVLAGPGEPESRVTVELLATDGAWSVRETDGSTVLQEHPVAGATTDEVVVEIGTDRVAVAAGGNETTLGLAGPLATDGQAAGLYAHLEPGRR